MKTLFQLAARRGFSLPFAHDFPPAPLETLVHEGVLDSFIFSHDTGYAPLGASLPFLEAHLDHTRESISAHAHRIGLAEKDGVTLAALKPRREGSPLRGVVLAPGQTSACYRALVRWVDAQPYRDFYYNVNFEAIAHLSRTLNARKIGMTHLSACDGFREEIAFCTAEALGHFWDDANASSLDVFAFAGCCIKPEHLHGIPKRLNTEGRRTSHRAINVATEEVEDGVTYIHLSWNGTSPQDGASDA